MAQAEVETAAQAKAPSQPVSLERQNWEEVLQFWFPDSPDEDVGTHGRHWAWRMQGGADTEIVARFSDLTEQAASGALDHWADDPKGRLALLILLDQFPRSVWRDTPRAFAQDPRALALALEGLENGHFAALSLPWERLFYVLPLGHCEGPDHVARLDRAHQIAQEVQSEAPNHLKPAYVFPVEQQVLLRRVIEAFGRHPHRNAILGRASTPEEEAYVAKAQFPHLRPIPHERLPEGDRSAQG